MISTYRLVSSRLSSGVKFYGLIAILLAALVSGPSGQAASFLSIEPAEPSVSSCLAFGAGPGGLGNGSPGFQGTSPYMGFIYRDIPPFELEIGDILSFDLGKENDFDVEINIALAATTVNGGEQEAGGFTTVVTSLQTPLNPRGDAIIGNFEMQFVVGFPFSFPGGGLIIRFSNGSEAYRQDLTCDESQVGVVAESTDSSGFFVRAFWADDDGVAPWDPDPATVSLTREIIGGFRILPDPMTNTVLDATGAETVAAAVGDVITYQIVVTNSTLVDATGVQVTNTLSDDLSFVQTMTNPSAGTMVDVGPPQSVVWTVGNLPAGQSATLKLDAQVLFKAMGKDITNLAELTAIDQPFGAGVDAESSILIIDLPDDILSYSDGGNCFIATAAFGSYLEPEVRVLRKFRDEYLMTNGAGRAFVDWYYRTSPPIAAVIGEHAWMRSVVRAALSPAVYGLKYPVASVWLTLMSAFLLLGYRRQTNRGRS